MLFGWGGPNSTNMLPMVRSMYPPSFIELREISVKICAKIKWHFGVTQGVSLAAIYLDDLEISGRGQMARRSVYVYKQYGMGH